MLQDDVSAEASVAAPTAIAKKPRKRMPVTTREQFNMAYTLFKKMAGTLSQLAASDFQEKYSLLLDIYDLIKKGKPVRLMVRGTITQ